jgi:hypothetical protein
MSTLTKLAFDKTLAEMHNNHRIHQNRRLELGSESPSLRSSGNGILFNDVSSDSDSDASSGSNGSFGTINNRHSYLSISDESSSPSSMGVSYAFMSSARGSRLLQEEELARLSDVPIDSVGGEPAVNPHISALTMDRNLRSPSLVKDKRVEYFAKIKNDILTGNTLCATPPPMATSSPPDDDSWTGKRVHRHSFALNQSLDSIEDKREKDKDKDKEKAKMKKEEKERLKEEKLRKKLEKKEFKQKVKATTSPDPPSIGSENSNFLSKFAIKPRATLSHRGGMDLEEQLRRPIDTSQKEKENPLRRSTSFNFEPTLDDTGLRSRPTKFERLLGPPAEAETPPPTEDVRPSWRMTKLIKNIHSDPFPAVPALLPPPPPPPSTNPPEESPPSSPNLSLSSTPDEQEPIKQRRVPKIYQILGENPNLATVIDISNIDTATNTSIDMDMDEEGIVFSDVREQSGHRQVKGATLKKLVERLTCESLSDTTFLLQFIITYRSFTNPHELLELLKARFESGIEISQDATDSEKEQLTKKQLIVRLRVYNVIRHWIDKQWMDFLEDKTLVDKMLSYAPMLNEVVSAKSSTGFIDKMIEKKLAEGEKQKKFMFSGKPPEPHIPTAPKEKWRLLDLHPEEIARQMTLMEYTLFKAIKPWEYLCWNTKMKQTKSANILAMINKFNVMSKWVQVEVLNGGETPKQRAVIIGKFLEICEYLRALKNYNGIMELLSGLNASAIHRLKLTWACLSSKQTEVFQDFNTFTTGHNFKNLRNALHTLQPPCIPYLGMYLTDLTFINDGIPLYLPESCLINFDKCRKVSSSVLEIMQYQQTPFCLHPVEDIQSYLAQLEKKLTQTDDEIYKLSLALEERK